MKKTLLCIPLALSLTIAISMAACTKSGGGSDNGSSDNGSSSSGTIRTDCGVVVQGVLKNPVALSDGIAVEVTQALGGNQVAVIPTGSTGPILVKIHGLGAVSDANTQAATSRLSSLTGSAYLFRPGTGCNVTATGGGQAEVAAIVTSNGVSFAESMAKTGLVSLSPSDVCGGEKISACLQGLQQSEPETAGELDSFLWKPTSDSDSHLAVHTGPYDTTVIVNGETGRNAGPGNGYGSLARFSRGGCAYGSPSIKVIDTSSGLPYTINGQTVFTLSSPCSRNCLTNGSIAPCSK